MRRSSYWMGIGLLIACVANGQGLINGTFDQGVTGWNTNYGKSGSSVYDINGDSRNELVCDIQSCINQYEGVMAVQDVPASYVDLRHGVALLGDASANGLPISADFKAFLKLEFLDQTSNEIPWLTMSGEYDPTKYATNNERRLHTLYIKRYRDITNQLHGTGVSVTNVQALRVGCLVFRYDNHGTVESGQGYFDNLSLGLISSVADDPGIVNGEFEFNEWGWDEYSSFNPTGWTVTNVNSDSDRELKFDAAGLNGQYASKLWVQEFDARAIDFTQGISLLADLGASNLTKGLQVFHKLEFSTNGPPYGGGNIFPTIFASSESTHGLCASNNEVQLGSTITMDYATLSNQLTLAGSSVDKLTYVRAIVFLMQFDASPPAADGFAWYDNVRARFDYKNRPTASGARKEGADRFALTWPSSAGITYKIQELTTLGDFHWVNVATGIAGQVSSTSFTGVFSNTKGFLRVAKE